MTILSSNQNRQSLTISPFQLFSQVLLGYKTKQDLDILVHRLEENHGILTHMAGRENDSEASSALPKLLLEIVSQVEDSKMTQDLVQQDENNSGDSFEIQKPTCEIGTILLHTYKNLIIYLLKYILSLLVITEFQNLSTSNATPEEIAENLPKVWRVLMELLSHQTIGENNADSKVTTCYKSVETKSGPVLVPSVSQTYIRLKVRNTSSPFEHYLLYINHASFIKFSKINF